MSAFSDYLSKIGDAVVDLGTEYGRSQIEKEMAEDSYVRTEKSKAGGVVEAGQPAPVKVTSDNPDNFNVMGLELNKTAVYVAGGALALVVVIKLVRG